MIVEYTYTDDMKDSCGEVILATYAELSKETTKKVSPNNELSKVAWSLLPSNHKERKSYLLQLINQPLVKSLDELYELAESKKLKFNEFVPQIAKQNYGKALLAGIKGKVQAKAKAEFKYKDGNAVIAWHCFTHLVCAIITFGDFKSMYECVRRIIDNAASMGVQVKEFSDRYQNPFKGGYRDIQFSVAIDDHIYKLQLSTKHFPKAKEESGHQDYKVIRELQADVLDGALDGVKTVLKFGDEKGSEKGTSEESQLKKLLRSEPDAKVLFHTATKNSDYQIISLLLESGASILEQDEDGNTPVHIEVMSGFESCV